ncbi:MAG: response regulator PleD [Pseudomonadota bacterium]
MNIIQDKILSVAFPDTKTIIQACVNEISGIELLTAETEKKAFELIYTHPFVLIIIDQRMPGIDIHTIGSMLKSHKKIHNAPLLIITKDIQQAACLPENFLMNHKDLYIDFISAPFDTLMMQNKISYFYEFYKLNSAVNQSMEELDNAYQKMIEQHDNAIKEQVLQKKSALTFSMAANRMQQSINGLLAGISHLQKDRKITGKSKPALLAIKNYTQRIEQLSKQGTSFPKRTESKKLSGSNIDRVYRMLYVEKSNEDFGIFNHLLKGIVACKLIQATTIEQSMTLIANNPFDLIFVSDTLPDGAGLHLLSRLKQIQPDIPVVFTLNRAVGHKGPKAISKGAFAYLLKEELSGDILSSTISGIFEKARIIRAAEDARGRIVLVSQKDALTRLHNRSHFEEQMTVEMVKTKRYHTPLSLLMIHFNTLNTITKEYDHLVSDQIISISAALIQDIIRESDIISRFSFDQFGILLPHTDSNGAHILANRIKDRITTHDFVWKDVRLYPGVIIARASCDPENDPDDFSLIAKALERQKTA